jgi:hypothetical protein
LSSGVPYNQLVKSISCQTQEKFLHKFFFRTFKTVHYHSFLSLSCEFLADSLTYYGQEPNSPDMDSLKDAELLQQFKAVEQFTEDDKTVVKKLIDAFIVKKQLQLMAS